MTQTISLEDLARDSALQELMSGGGCPTEEELDRLTAEILKELQEDDMEPMHDAQLPGLMALDPAEVEEPKLATPREDSVLLIRRDTKQGWKQATKQVMKDSADRLRDLAAGMNEELGWAKYGVENA